MTVYDLESSELLQDMMTEGEISRLHSLVISPSSTMVAIRLTGTPVIVSFSFRLLSLAVVIWRAHLND